MAVKQANGGTALTSTLAASSKWWLVASTALPLSSSLIANAGLTRTNIRQDDSGAVNTTTFTGGAFTPDANSLLVVVAGCTGFNNDLNPSAIISGGGLVWTKKVEANSFSVSQAGDNNDHVSIWIAQVGASPSSMTVALNTTPNQTWFNIKVFSYLGYDTTNPIGAVGSGITNTQGAAAFSYNLNANPLATSEVLSGCNLDNGTVIDIAIGTGWTAQLTSGLNGAAVLAFWTETRIRSTSPTVLWDRFDDQGWGGASAAVEIRAAASASGVTTFQGTAVLALSSSILADSQEYNIAIATLPAGSLLSADTDQIWVTNPAVLSATSSLAVNALEYDVASALLPCTSDLSANAQVYKPALATLPLNSLLTATTQIAVRGAAVLPATSDWLAISQLAMVGRATLSATSSLSAAPIQYFVASSVLGASSSLSALVSIRWPSSAILPLNSSLITDPFIKGQVFGSATLPLTSTLSCSTIQLFAAQAVLPLTSSWSADSIQRGQIPASATLAPTAIISGFGSQRWTSQSAYVLSSTLSSFAAQRWSTAATLSATSSLLVDTLQSWSARAQYDCVSTLQAKAGQRWLALATLLANSTIQASGDDISASNVSLTLNLSSSLRADSTYVKLVRHWQRHLTAHGVVALPKQLRGAITRPNITGEVS